MARREAREMAAVRVSFERLRRGRGDIHGLRMANELRPRMLGSGSRANSRRFNRNILILIRSWRKELKLSF